MAGRGHYIAATQHNHFPWVRVCSAKKVFCNIPKNLPEELITVLQEVNGVRIERIISTGYRSPDGCWYDQEEHEWVMVLTGAARLAFEDRVVELRAGGFMNISAQQKHSVAWKTPCKTSQR